MRISPYSVMKYLKHRDSGRDAFKGVSGRKGKHKSRKARKGKK